MMDSYFTTQGDTWDFIAFKLWKSEYLLPLLLEANPKHRDVIIFPGNIELYVPRIDPEIYTERPSWLGNEEQL